MAVVVVAPAPECAIGFGGTTERVTSADAIPDGTRANLCGGFPVGGCSVAELARTVGTPAPQSSIGLCGACIA